MTIRISQAAEKEVRKLPKFDQIAIARKIRSLVSVPISGEEKLSGFKNIFRVRVGNYRIVYRRTLNDIFIILVRHRKDVYKKLGLLMK
jgi:mRNA interferase RelE/StbE